DVTAESVDGALWGALLAPRDLEPDAARREIAGKTLTLGIVPALGATEPALIPGGPPAADVAPLVYELPLLPPGGMLPPSEADRVAVYRPLDARATTDVLNAPGLVELTLPGEIERLRLWSNLEPLEGGVGDFPPSLDVPDFNRRLLTWLRIRPALADRPSRALNLRLLWVGINATMVSQRARVNDEPLPAGTGEPDQVVTLARGPVIPGSVQLTVLSGEQEERWAEVDDLAAAGPEVPTIDRRGPPGLAVTTPPRASTVFVLDPEAGTLRFGDGFRGKRPPRGAVLRASYDYGAGAAGNVGAGAITGGPGLPPGITASNPVRTWGGADAESTADGERQVSRFLQHRDRLVTAADFKTITWRTPGVAPGRVEVLPAFHPALSPNEPGDAPGAVTLLLIPRYDPLQPDAPMPDRLFLDAVCAYLDPRRLVTSEVFLRGPVYKGIWISVGIDLVAGAAAAEVRERVRDELLRTLAPLPATPGPDAEGGWPLRKPVAARELMAVATRVTGVLLVNDLLLAEGAGGSVATVAMRGLELPRVLGIAVSVGDPLSLDALRGGTLGADQIQRRQRVLPVPSIPEECR
ncbi:MAG: putative baseplate assembly protein, partial [Chloroflexaceae bacterium]|nr:putative baseplate assembly protein [Chloroflexaceae bacterium]